MKKRIMKSIFTIFILISGFFVYEVFGQSNNGNEIIYEADRDGNSIKGNLEELLDYVQSGNPVRVGWVLKMIHPQSKDTLEMQHWSDAGFITTLRGHVFAQIKPIFQQGPGLDIPPNVFLVNGEPNGWVAILGTTGDFRQKYKPDEEMREFMRKDGMTDEQILEFEKKNEHRKVHTKWAVMRN